MGMNAFLTIPGIKGSARQRHVVDKIVICGVTAEVAAEIDSTSGLPQSGKSKHKPMVLLKEFDRASPALYESLKNGTKHDKATLEFWRMPPGGGGEQMYYTINLEGVQVAGIQMSMPNTQVAANEMVPELEELSLTYSEISYVFSAGGKEGGTDPKEGDFTEFMKAEFEIPIEAKIRALALDYGKDATKFFASEVYAMFKPPAEAKK